MDNKIINKTLPMLLIVWTFLSLTFCTLAQSNEDIQSNFNLNHFYISIDSASFQALLDHPDILSEYFEADSGMPDFGPINDTTGIIYLRGKTIYMELMGPKNRFGVSEGTVGLGFSEDTQLPLTEDWEKQIDDLFFGMGTQFGNNSHKLNNGKSIKWFDTAYIPDSLTSIYTWYSRFNPEFLSAITGKNHQTYTREEYLSLTRTGKKTVQNISGISLELNARDFERISKEFELIQTDKTKDTNTIKSYRIGDVDIDLHLSDISKLSMVRFQTVGNASCKIKLGNIEFICHENQLRMQFL